MIDYSIFAKFKQIIVIFKSFPRIKYCNNIHNNYVSIVINRQTKQKYITKASRVVHSQKKKKKLWLHHGLTLSKSKLSWTHIYIIMASLIKSYERNCDWKLPNKIIEYINIKYQLKYILWNKRIKIFNWRYILCNVLPIFDI